MSVKNARAVFVELVSHVPQEHWDVRLAELAGADEELRLKVAGLLAAHRQADSFLEKPADLLGGTVDPITAAREASTPEGDGERPGEVLADRYKLVEAIGAGGMGNVWLAQQMEPVKRLVAVKLIKAGMDSKAVLARFEAERQALALMDHPHIAKVLDGGMTADGRPYFVMELVKGVPITRYCDEHHLTPRQRLELFIPVCQAVQHAHQKGVIHRDVKPSNVLVAPYDGKPVVKVIDFGIAKAAGQQLTERTLVTGFGAIVGTLEYMSPEQAELNNQDIDTRSDVYSLGVLLYELLTGNPPFTQKELEQGGVLEMLRLIREQEPTRPSTKLSTAEGLPTLAANRGTEPKRLTKLMRGELDWIVMKALEKDRSRRYETANSFALDIQRYLADEPVLASPPRLVFRCLKWARRRRALAAVCGLVLLVLMLTGLTSGATGLWHRAEKARAAEAEAHQTLRQVSYLHRVALARQAWLDNDLEQADLLLENCPPELRRWEWYYLRRLCRQALFSFPRPGQSSELVDSLVFTPDQKRLRITTYFHGRNGVYECDLVTGRVIQETHLPTSIPRGTSHFSLDGGWAATKVQGASGWEVKVHNLATAKEVRTLPWGEWKAVNGGLAFSPDSRCLALGLPNKTVKVWDLTTGQVVTTLGKHGDVVSFITFSPDGRRIASISMGGTVRVSDAATGQEMVSLLGTPGTPLTAAFSQDGRRLATNWDRLAARVWDVHTGQEVCTLWGHTDSVSRMTFSPDGTRLATASADKTAKVWDVTTGKEILTLRGHTQFVTAVAFSPDGTRLATSALDRTVKVWDASGVTFPEYSTLRAGQSRTNCVAFSPKGTYLACGREDGTITMWEPATNKKLVAFQAHAGGIQSISFSPDGTRLASGANDSVVKVWRARTGEEVLRLPGFGRATQRVAFSPDGQHLLCGSDRLRVKSPGSLEPLPPAKSVITVWNAWTGEKVHTIAGIDHQIEDVVFSPDGKKIAADLSTKLQLWDVTTRQECLTLKRLFRNGEEPWSIGVTGRVFPVFVGLGGRGIALSPDGWRIAASVNTAIQVWETTGKEVFRFRQGFTGGLAFSPDSTRLASAGASMIKLWDMAIGDEALTLNFRKEQVGPGTKSQFHQSLVFSRDGHRLAAVGADGTVRVWDATPLPDQQSSVQASP